MNHRHVALWLDHAEAKIFHLEDSDYERNTVPGPHHHLSSKEPRSQVGVHPTEDEHYFHAIAKALLGSEEILVVGPSTAKLFFIKHVHKHDHDIANKIVGVETVDHPTDGQIVAYARKYFLKVDKMKGTAAIL